MQQAIAKHRLVAFYVLAFVVSWAAWGAMAVVYKGDKVAPMTYVFSTIGGLGPLLSLAILQKATRKEFRVDAILATIRLRDSKWRWFIPAALAYPAVVVLGNLASLLAEEQTAFRLLKPGPDQLGLAALPLMFVMLAAMLLTSPLFEEPGWRGFALVSLQRRFGRELGSLIVGALWWLWHQPMNIPFGSRPSVAGFVSQLALSFLIDSLYNLSGRNLFAAMLVHASSAVVIAWLYEAPASPLSLGPLIVLLAALRAMEARAARVPRSAPAMEAQAGR